MVHSEECAMSDFFFVEEKEGKGLLSLPFRALYYRLLIAALQGEFLLLGGIGAQSPLLLHQLGNRALELGR